MASVTGSSEETDQQVVATPSAPAAKPDIKQTMADLDALLGIEDKPEEEAPQVGGPALAAAAAAVPARRLAWCLFPACPASLTWQGHTKRRPPHGCLCRARQLPRCMAALTPR